MAKAQIGEVVDYYDERGKRHDALVTNGGESWCNVVYCNDIEEQTDSYGRKLLRASSVTHGRLQEAWGRYWLAKSEGRVKPKFIEDSLA